MGGCLVRGLGDDRHVQAAADCESDLAERHTLLSDRVIPGSCGALLKCQPVETGSIEPVDRGPRLSPSPTNAETPFSRATAIR